MSNKTNLQAVELLMSDNRGVYIPRDFANECTIGWSGVTDEQRAELQNVDGDSYWDIWDEVLNNAEYKTEQGTWCLYQDGDLFAICYELMTDEEKENMGFELD